MNLETGGGYPTDTEWGFIMCLFTNDYLYHDVILQ